MAAGVVAVVVWGASFAATKRLLVEVSPLTILFVRTLLAVSFIVAGLAFGRRLRALPSRAWPAIFGLALVGLVATQLLQAYALMRSTAANTAWLVALNPVVTALLAAWLLGERLAGRITGLAVAFCGAVLVASGGHGLSAAWALPSTRGDMLTLASTLSWALYTVYGRGLATQYPPATLTAYVLAATALLFAVPFAAGGLWAELATLSPTGWLCLGYLGIACSGLAFLLYQAALEQLDASRVAAFIYLEPLVAQALSIAVLDEPLTAAVLVGGGAILGGVYLVTRPRRAS